jgi:hypothetical protein
MLDNVIRISESEYIPTAEDIVRSRVRTSGIVEQTVFINKVHFKSVCHQTFEPYSVFVFYFFLHNVLRQSVLIFLIYGGNNNSGLSMLAASAEKDGSGSTASMPYRFAHFVLFIFFQGTCFDDSLAITLHLSGCVIRHSYQ